MPAKKKPAAKPAPQSLDDLLSAMDTTAKPVSAAPEKIKRLEMVLDPEDAKNFAILIGFHAVQDKIKTRFENKKDEVSTALFDAWTAFVWEHKYAPSKNPSVKSADKANTYSAIYQVQKRFCIDLPEVIGANQTPESLVISMLKDLGVNAARATRIVKQELDFTPKRCIRPLNDVMLMEGGNEAVRKFLAMCLKDAPEGKETIVVEPLSGAERDLLFYTSSSVKVRDGFFDRLPGLVESLAELRAVLKVIEPVAFPSHMKLVSEKEFDTLLDIASEMLGLDFVEKAEE